MKYKAIVGSCIASSVALAFATMPLIVQADTNTDAKVKCAGVNSCNGTSDCATAKNSCKGHNTCAGQGWVYKTRKECLEAGGSILE